MGLISEFKEFALKGSVVDLAVGVIIGAAFGSIVNSLVKDVMMPPLGLLMGGVDFSDKKIILRNAVYDPKDIAHAAAPLTPEVDLWYGRFINNVIQFLIVAIAIFIVIKLMNSAKRKPAPAPATPPAPTKEEVLLTEIRDAIRAK
jgi:large conductance mechanosensitive channel